MFRLRQSMKMNALQTFEETGNFSNDIALPSQQTSTSGYVLSFKEFCVCSLGAEVTKFTVIYLRTTSESCTCTGDPSPP